MYCVCESLFISNTVGQLCSKIPPDLPGEWDMERMKEERKRGKERKGVTDEGRRETKGGGGDKA